MLQVVGGEMNWTNTALNAGISVACFAYWGGWAPMRRGILVVPVLIGASILTVEGYGVEFAAMVALALAISLVLAWFNARNRLFFRLDVTPAALEKSWRRYMDPRIPYVALALACLSACIPLLAFVSVPLWVSILLRSDPVTGKPILRGGFAAIGLFVTIVAALVGFVAMYNFFSTPSSR
ncbi:hypothetical protein COSO111634_15875 [Corallococcus soli]